MASKRKLLLLAGIALSGTLFGAGLVLAGMTQPSKVLGFLDVTAIATGTWDPTLMFVLGGAVVTTFIGFRLLLQRRKPFWATAFQWPKATALDIPLLGGSALFGIGWGLAGYCPGPALASLVSPSYGSVVFVAAMLGGMAAAKLINNRKGK